ncbi:hypothetical protein Acr_21g0008120 [Actinidia rufa]|uniref:Uncharacterized protein n=1 Tax=Actinidia rufa TaxID=165716 RepID=A0A7J0GHB8_9ERIC|nr:hypothetical protein Acr_21g0008120 [Actinidia rufa]
MPVPSHRGALYSPTGTRRKVCHFASHRDSISPPLCTQLERSPPLIKSRVKETHFGGGASVATFTRIPKYLPTCCTALDPPSTPMLALRDSVQLLLLLSILLANTTGPMSASNSSCLDTPSS